MILSFSLMKPQELEALKPELTVFLFPVGGLEQHGPHLPMGVKTVQAEVLSRSLGEELARRLPGWTLILMPVLPLSVDTITQRLALPVRPHVVRDAMVDQCDQLKRLGFMHFVMVNSTLSPKQITALEDAAKLVSGRAWFFGKRASAVSVTGALVDAKIAFKSPLAPLPIEHGGAEDTSFLLAFAPEWVSKEFSGLPSVPRPDAGLSRFFEYLSGDLDGYWGNPASASADQGRSAIFRTASSLAEKLVPWLERGQGGGQFLSAYRYFPVNGSFFKAYVLSALFFMMMMLWVIWTVRDSFAP
jgi:creatinine amidohydrolase